NSEGAIGMSNSSVESPAGALSARAVDGPKTAEQVEISAVHGAPHPNSLVGAWRLVNHFFQREDGEERNNMTPHTVAYLIYTVDGHMAYHHMRSICPAFASGDLHGGTPEERLAAFDNVNCYCGTYDVRDNTVVHHVEAATFPNWVGTDLVRKFTL